MLSTPVESAESLAAPPHTDPIPDYLSETYWWAYLTPQAIRFFDRQWVTDLILWGNYARLSNSVIAELPVATPCQIVQIGSVYGSLTKNLATALSADSHYTVVDVAPIQLVHLQSKMGDVVPIHYLQCDATQLRLPSNSTDLTLLFFLLHEVPDLQKVKVLNEAWRITRPGGKLVVIDYHQPNAFNPLHWLMRLILRKLEPFALALWRQPVQHFLTAEPEPAKIDQKTFFGGLYQQVQFFKAGVGCLMNGVPPV